jgi:flagellar basal body L-ring protein FlgH
VIDECGHCPQIEKAAQFNDLVAAFVRESESAEKKLSEDKRQYNQSKRTEMQIGIQYEA